MAQNVCSFLKAPECRKVCDNFVDPQYIHYMLKFSIITVEFQFLWEIFAIPENFQVTSFHMGSKQHTQ